MKKGIFKKVLLGTLALSMLVSLTGCEEEEVVSKEEYNKVVKNLNAYKQGYAKLKNSVVKANEENVKNSLRDVTGKGNYEFETIDNLIKFPTPLTLKGSFVDVNRSSVRVGSLVTMSPSTNWVIRFNNSITYLDHPSKIHASIRTIGSDYDVKPGVPFFKSSLQRFFAKFPKGDITYRRIFVGSTVSGLMGTINVTVDKKPHVVSAIVSSYSSTGFLMVIDYEDNRQGTQQEMVDSLIQSVVVENSIVRVE